jgi:RNA polymerase sigma-70 factor (ECF subfamily)
MTFWLRWLFTIKESLFGQQELPGHLHGLTCAGGQMVLSDHEQFVQRLIEHQPRLRAFIRSLILIQQDADDVLQETNVVLCRKAEEYVEGSSFSAWALQVAYFQVLAHRQSLSRSRLVFEDQMIRELADVAVDRLQAMGDREEALRYCLAHLSVAQRQILARRYEQEASVTRIAGELSRPIASVRQSLYRIRSLLQACIDRRLARQRGHE